jgi:TIR domain/NACHT domain
MNTVEIFYFYAHEDEPLRRDLHNHLGSLRSEGLITEWYDRDIIPGAETNRDINAHLNSAHIILVLISADFIGSDHFNSKEMQRAMERHHAGEACVIPIILRPVEWKSTLFDKLQALPADGNPITRWFDKDEAFKHIALEIRKIVESMQWVYFASSRHDQQFVSDLRSDIQSYNAPVRFQVPEDPTDIEAIGTAIRGASAVILIASLYTPSSPLIKKELEMAAIFNKQVIPLWIRGETWREVLPKECSEKNGIDARDVRNEVILQALLEHLKRRTSFLFMDSLPFKEPEEEGYPRNPYKGLKSFYYEDAHDFFGRDALIHRLFKKFEESLDSEEQTANAARLLVVVGASGSGKSSAIMAGLLPLLKRGDSLPGSNNWIYLDPIRPDRHPINSLATTLYKQLGGSIKSIQEDLLDSGALNLHSLATSLTASHQTKVVLVVDQFEELFAETISEEERQQFIDLLVTSITEPSGPVVVIMTLQASFSDRPMQYQELGKLIEAHQVTAFPMEMKGLRDVIEKPAQLPDVQVSFESNLVGDLLFEMYKQPMALPLLQFTLFQLFEAREGHLLTLNAYREIGGVKGALSNFAQETFKKLPTDKHRKFTRLLFLRLIDPGIQEQDVITRRVALEELSFPDPTDTAIIRETADFFVKVRLLTTNTSAGITTLEISHGELIRAWEQLSDWLKTYRGDAELQKTISEDAAKWIQHGRPKDLLYQKTLLSKAQTWAKSNMPNSDEAAFLEASSKEHYRQEAEEKSIRIQKLAVRVMPVLIVALIAVLVLSRVLDVQYLANLPVSVTNLNDHGDGSLREAIANARPSSIITFAPTLKGGTITLTSGELKITKNLEIDGLEPTSLTISGGNTSRVFYVSKGIVASLSFLTLKDGYSATRSGDIAAGLGGCIYNDSNSTLTLTNVTIINNRSDMSGGGIYNDTGTLILTDTTISNNTALGSGGGGIDNAGMLILTKSIVFDNLANIGGGIYNLGNNLTIVNSTIANNIARGKSGGIGGGIAINRGKIFFEYSTIYHNTAESSGGGVVIMDLLNSAVAITNCIIAGNYARGNPDMQGTFTLYSHNLIQVTSGATFILTDRSPTSLIKGRSPSLGSLGENGGPTKTYPLLSGSPAIDQIPFNDITCGQTPEDSIDQRGISRPQGSGCDLGAYEYGPS